MDCPNGIRQCPNGWTDCELCAHWNKQTCTYLPEEQDPDPELISELTENELTNDLGVNIPSIRGTWAERFLALSPDEALKQFYSKHTPDLHHKEPIPAGNGIPGGGSKTKGNKKPIKKKPEYMKFLGM